MKAHGGIAAAELLSWGPARSPSMFGECVTLPHPFQETFDVRHLILRFRVLLPALILALGCGPIAAAGTWQAAVGSLAITPDEPIWMGGYAARTEPSEGAIHDLYAKVLIVQDEDGNRIVIVTTDLLGVTPELRSRIGGHVQRLGIAPESLLINASHTHCGPELRADRLERYGVDSQFAAKAQQYVQQTATKIGELIESTLAKLQPAELQYSFARAGFAMNRRLPTANGFVNSPNPEGPVDHTVPVLRVVSEDDRLLGILFGYACHATTLGIQQLCGDYPGFAQQYLEESHPGAVALFLNGCSADQNPYPRRKLELAKQHGRALANAVETALETRLTYDISGPLSVAMESATLEFQPPPSRDELEELAASSNRYDRFHATALLEELEENGRIQTAYDCFPVQVVQFGEDLTLVAICGEVVVDYALRLKKELSRGGDHQVWVAGYSNHVFGYLPSRRVLTEGGYEGGGAMRYTTFPGPFDESVEQRIIDKVKELVQQSSRAE